MKEKESTFAVFNPSGRLVERPVYPSSRDYGSCSYILADGPEGYTIT